MALLGLTPPDAAIVAGSIRIDGREIGSLRPKQLAALRGDRIALVPQSAMHALDPVLDVGSQIVEVIRAHRDVSTAAARRRAAELMGVVGLPVERMSTFPHELSGGMRQRVVLAIALADQSGVAHRRRAHDGRGCGRRRRGSWSCSRTSAGGSVSRWSSCRTNLPAVARVADRILVLHAGRIVESGPTAAVIRGAASPVTRSLLDAVPRLRSSEWAS